MFALIDVNGMYASCEQAFRPDLANRAVAVLSNNDGNIVARNYLAKKAGLKMGDPYFKSSVITSLFLALITLFMPPCRPGSRP